MAEDSPRVGSENASDQSPDPHNRKDWLLNQLVDLVNTTGLRIPITVQSGGAMISGWLISGAKYFDLFADQISASAPAQLVEALRSYKQYASIYSPSDQSGSARDKAYFHIENAEVLVPGQLPFPGGAGLLWRGTLAGVAGWSYGLFVVERRRSS